MLRVLILLIFILPITLYTQNSERVSKFWSENDTLVYSDFTLKDSFEIVYDSYNRLGLIKYTWKNIYNSNKELIGFKNCMYKDSSFIINNEDAFLTLKHESAHFDISEMYLRMTLNKISKINLDTSFKSLNEYIQFSSDLHIQIKEIKKYYSNLESDAQDNFHEKIATFLEKINPKELELLECQIIKDRLLDDFKNYNNATVFFEDYNKLRKSIERYIFIYNEKVNLYKTVYVPLYDEYKILFDNGKYEKAKLMAKELKQYYFDDISKYEEVVNLFPEIYDNISFLEALGFYYYDIKNYSVSAKYYVDAILLSEDQINNPETYDEKLNKLYDELSSVYDSYDKPEEALKLKIKRNIRDNNK